MNRKTHKIAKKIFPFLIFIFCIKPAIYLTKCLIPRDLVVIIVTYGFDFAMILVSHLIVPKWNMNTSSKSIMNKEEKDKQILKNKHLKENYKVRERNK